MVAALAVFAACGSEDPVAVEPAGCVSGLERNGEPGELDIRVGDAWFVGLRETLRRPWREYWDRRDNVARIKAGIVVPAGGTLHSACRRRPAVSSRSRTART